MTREMRGPFIIRYDWWVSGGVEHPSSSFQEGIESAAGAISTGCASLKRRHSADLI
jgi:hypothetical protein